MTPKTTNRAHIHNALALLVIIGVIVLDQYTKYLVVTYLRPTASRSASLVGHYLVLHYVQNDGAAFSVFTNTTALVALITVMLIVVGYVYLRILNSGPLYYKVTFGLIIGGALGNVIDRIHNGGYVVDFIALRIPQIKFHFAIFNIADACISIGVLLFFVFIFFTRRSYTEQSTGSAVKEAIHNE